MDEKVFIKKSTLTSIGDAIRNKEGSTEKIPPLEMPARIEAIGGGGIPPESITAVTLWSLNGFGRSKVELYFPFISTLQNLVNLASATTSAERVNTTVEELTITCENQITSVSNAFINYRNIPDKKLRKLTLNCDLSTATGFSAFLQNHQAIEEILGTPIDLSSATSVSNFCNGCTALREIRFQGAIKITMTSMSCPFSKASILSIFDCLADDVSDKALLLSLDAVNTAFETSEGAADGSASAEWTALVESKPNWTISLAK